MGKKAITVEQRKYELVADDTVTSWDGRKLFRVRALVAIGLSVAVGDLGGYVESEKNLSHVSGDAWVYGDARVSGNARVYGNARVSGNARVYGNARVSGNARVYGNARVSGDAWVYGDAHVSGDAWVYGNAQVSGNARVSGDARVAKVNITAVRSDGYTFSLVATPIGARIIAGCRYFSLDESEEHWTKTRGDTPLGEESLLIVAHFRRMAVVCGLDEPVATLVEQEAL